MPPSSDYTTSGGGLKLKGAKPLGVEKKKKKKSKALVLASGEKGDNAEPEAAPSESQSRKTEAEIRHEEVRRKRMMDKIMKEGTKTHKERVEELNKYLSGLSEHHDMPRIGPG